MAGTATTQRTPTDITFDYEGVWATRIAQLRAAIQAGSIIYYSDINSIRDGLVAMVGHYHTYTDVKQAATYGTAYGADAGYGSGPAVNRGAPNGGGGYGSAPDYGMGDRTTYSVDKNTTLVKNAADTTIQNPTFISFAQNSTIAAVDHTNMKNVFDALRTHSHKIDDATTL